MSLKLTNRIRGKVTIRRQGSDAETVTEVCMKGIYDELSNLVKTAKTVIDLGANIGLATRYFSRLYPESRIISVEPHLENYQILKSNVADLSNRVTTVRAAIWSSDGQVDIGCSGNSFDSISVRAGGESRVESVTLKTLMRDDSLEHIDILKVDIEGAEVELFSTANDWIERVKCIAIEFHGDSRSRSNFDAIVSGSGFEVFPGEHTVIAIRR